MTAKYIIICCLLTCSTFKGFTQKDTTKETQPKLDSAIFAPQALNANEFTNFQLPPIQTLFENARKNPRMEAIQAAIEAAKCDVKLAKRDWLSFFTLRAGYTYGILGTYTDQETQNTPLTTVYSGATQNSWSVGANVGIPLNTLINHRATVKKQKQVVENVKYSQDIVFNEIKMEIVELYANVQAQLKILTATTEAVTLSTANYNVGKKDFANNRINPNDLAEIKEKQKKALVEFELVIMNINIYLFKLEIITNTKLTQL